MFVKFVGLLDEDLTKVGDSDRSFQVTQRSSVGSEFFGLALAPLGARQQSRKIIFLLTIHLIFLFSTCFPASIDVCQHPAIMHLNIDYTLEGATLF